jgi:hypothetical protein
MKETYRAELNASLRRALDAMTLRQRNLLRQQYLDGLSIDELSDLLAYLVSQGGDVKGDAEFAKALEATEGGRQ